MKHSKKLLKNFLESSGIFELKKKEQAKIKGGSDDSNNTDTTTSDSIIEDIDII